MLYTALWLLFLWLDKFPIFSKTARYNFFFLHTAFYWSNLAVYHVSYLQIFNLESVIESLIVWNFGQIKKSFRMKLAHFLDGFFYGPWTMYKISIFKDWTSFYQISKLSINWVMKNLGPLGPQYLAHCNIPVIWKHDIVTTIATWIR